MASLKKAIEAKCKDCTYDPETNGTWRDQTEQCQVTSCALWEVRPKTMATINMHRKTRDAGDDIDFDAILSTLEDEEEVC